MPESRLVISGTRQRPVVVEHADGDRSIEVPDDGGRDLLVADAETTETLRAPPASLDFALLRGALEEIPLGVATTRSGQILYANVALERLYGAARGGLDGKHVRVLFDAASFLRISTLLDEERIFDGRVHTVGLDGRSIDAEVHAEWYNSEALGIGGFLVFRDVSLELGALGRITDHLGGVLFRVRCEGGSLEFISPSVTKLTGLDPATCIEHPVLLTNLVSVDERERVAFLYQQIVSGEITAGTAQVSLRRPDGRLRVLQVYATGRRDTGNRVRHLDGVVIDVPREGPEAAHLPLHDGPSARSALSRRRDQALVAPAVMEIAQELLREAAQHLHSLGKAINDAENDVTGPGLEAAAIETTDLAERLSAMSRRFAAASALNRRVRRAMAGATSSATLSDLLEQVHLALGRVIGQEVITLDLGDAASVLIDQRVDELILVLIFLGLRAFRLVGSGTLKIEARRSDPRPPEAPLRARHAMVSEAQDTLIVIVGGAPPDSSLPGVDISAELQTIPRPSDEGEAFTAAKTLLAVWGASVEIDDLRLDEVCTIVRLRG